MALIEFKDLPDTTTPLNAANLNGNFNELNSKINTNISKLKTVTFNNDWMVVQKSYGGDILMMVPICNPDNVAPTLSLTNSEIYTSGGGWQTMPIYGTGVQTYGTTFAILRFNSAGMSLQNGECYLARMTGTLTVPN